MRLISCKIENFGKLHNVSIDFEKGLNSFVKENGWGKSTLAAFIKVMLYGFEDEGAKSVDKRERTRYIPWQGGVYGGSVVFEAEEKRYRVTRIFGSRQKEDSFELRDVETNLASDDFTEQIGEELFHIDRDSFLRTIFITQNDSATATTDSINAKLGNLAEHTDDINNFESVTTHFQDILNKLSSTRKTGSIYIRKNQIAELEREIKQKDSLDKAITELGEKKSQAKEEYNGLQVQKKELEKKQHFLQKQKDVQAKQTQYKMLCEAESKRRQELAEEKAYFPGKVPNLEEVQDYMHRSKELNELAQRVEQYRLLPEEEQVLQEPVMSQTELEQCQKIEERLQEVDSQIVSNNAVLQALKATAQNQPGFQPLWLILGAAFLAVGVFLSLMGAVFIGIPMCIVAVGLIPLSFIKKKKQTQPWEEQEQIIAQLKREREELARTRLKLLKGQMSLQDASYKAKMQASLVVKSQNFVEKKREYDVLKNQILTYLSELDMEWKDPLSQFAGLLEHLKSYQRASKQWQDAQEIKEQFEKMHGETISGTTAQEGEEESLLVLGEQMTNATDRMEELHQIIFAYQQQIDEQSEKRDLITDKESEVEQLRECQAAEEKKRELIEKTKELMELAKVSFTQKYMAPIMQGFTKYYEMMSGESSDKFFLDANTKLTVEEMGQQRDTKFFSAGYQDLMNVCMRMALVEAMYTEERPFLILDDPFVNLDKEKTKGGLEFLRSISKEYQVLYFSCHESRE